MIFMGRKMTERISKKLDDFEGMWSYKNHELEQIEFLDLLYNWTTQVSTPPSPPRTSPRACRPPGGGGEGWTPPPLKQHPPQYQGHFFGPNIFWTPQ